jgi:hypothetical protein
MTVRQWHLSHGDHAGGAAGTVTLERPVTVPAEPVTETPAR